MRSCRFETRIDEYLLNRLPEDEAAEFEEHYFNCAPCFADLAAREEVLQVIKTGDVFRTAPERVEAAAESPVWLRRLWASLTPRQWALAGAAALALVAVAVLIPRRPGPAAPQFFLTDDATVRGGAITLVFPVMDVRGPIPPFEWQGYGEDVEYRFTIANHAPLWETSTTETRIVLPEDIRRKLVPGETYVWQVKGFKKDGTLVAISSRVRFKIVP